MAGVVTDPITERIRRRHDDIPQDGLFEAPELAHAPEPQKKVAKPKVVMRVTCPVCDAKKVGVIRVLDDSFRPHYVINPHDRVTLRGHRFPCAGSGSEIEES